MINIVIPMAGLAKAGYEKPFIDVDGKSFRKLGIPRYILIARKELVEKIEKESLFLLINF